MVFDSFCVAAAPPETRPMRSSAAGFGEAGALSRAEREGLPQVVQRPLVVAESKVVASKVEERQAHAWAVAGALVGGQGFLLVCHRVAVPAPNSQVAARLFRARPSPSSSPTVRAAASACRK